MTEQEEVGLVVDEGKEVGENRRVDALVPTEFTGAYTVVAHGYSDCG